MKPFNIKLSDEDREKLELHRVVLGKRSHAEVIRHWIAQPVTVTGRSNGTGYTLTVGAPPAVPPAVGDGAPNEARFSDGRGHSLPAKPKVQIGPAKPAPGSRLKPEKGKK